MPESNDYPPDVKRKYKVLVANDDECQQYMIEVILKLNDYEDTIAQNGYEAFELASEALSYQQSNLHQIIEKWKNPQFMGKAKMYDIIILDLNMPISDGYDACKKIQLLYEGAKFF